VTGLSLVSIEQCDPWIAAGWPYFDDWRDRKFLLWVDRPSAGVGVGLLAGRAINPIKRNELVLDWEGDVRGDRRGQFLSRSLAAA
jgi:hypothetical protein